jgi:hypothetical protein
MNDPFNLTDWPSSLVSVATVTASLFPILTVTGLRLSILLPSGLPLATLLVASLVLTGLLLLASPVVLELRLPATCCVVLSTAKVSQSVTVGLIPSTALDCPLPICGAMLAIVCQIRLPILDWNIELDAMGPIERNTGVGVVNDVAVVEHRFVPKLHRRGRGIDVPTGVAVRCRASGDCQRHWKK